MGGYAFFKKKNRKTIQSDYCKLKKHIGISYLCLVDTELLF